MSSPPIQDASEVKRRGRQRLIGAIALVAVLVVFVAMVLDSEPRPPRPEKALAIPSKDNAPPLPAPPAPASPQVTASAVDGPGSKSEPPKADPAKTAVLETKQVSPKAPPSATPAPPPPGAAAATAAAAPKLEGFAVQVGAFRDEAKLSQARQKLGAANIKHYTERLEQQGGLTRLRAGPFPNREAAEGALASLKRAGLDGKVVPLP